MTDTLVQDYLERLRQAADRLPPERSAELVAEIREHIDAAVAAGEAGTEAELRDLLDRLGDPEEIVAAAADDEPAPPPAGRYRRPGIGLEITAVALMTLGSLILVVGWAVGAILLWTSRRWTTREKLLGTLVVPGGPFLILLSVQFGGRVCTSEQTFTDSAGGTTTIAEQCSGFAFPPYLGIPLFFAWLVLPFLVGGLLLGRARRRADAEPPVLVTGTSPWGGVEIAAVLLLALGGLLLPVVAAVAVGGFAVPLVGAVAGLVCVWVSTAWRAAEKGVATAIACAGAILPVIGVLLARAADADVSLAPPLVVVLMVAATLAGPIAALYLAVRLNARR